MKDKIIKLKNNKKFCYSILFLVLVVISISLILFLENHKYSEKTDVSNKKRLSSVSIAEDPAHLNSYEIQDFSCLSDTYICVSNLKITYYDNTCGIIDFDISYSDNQAKDEENDEEDKRVYENNLSGDIKIDLGYITGSGAFESTYQFLASYDGMNYGDIIKTMHGYQGFDFSDSKKITTFKISVASESDKMRVYDNIILSGNGDNIKTA